MTTNTRRLGTAVAAGALALVLAGCGQEATVEEAPGATGSAASDHTAGETVDREAFIARLGSPDPDRLRSFVMSLQLDADGQPLTVEGAVDLRSGAPAMDVDVMVPGMGAIDLLLVEGQAYLSLPGLTEDGQYLRLDPASMGMDLSQVTDTVDMAAGVQGWAAGAERIEFVGVEQVGQEQLEQFRMFVDLSEMTQGVHDSAMPTELGLPSGEELPDELTYDVWLDSEDFVRQAVFDLSGLRVEMTMDDWGQAVTVTAPDPDQVMELGDLGGLADLFNP